MVNDDGQLFTMEGFAGAIIMVVTAYLVLGTTSVYTPGDTHITDMQLEQLGSDALKMMDTPNEYGQESELIASINTTDGARFASTFTTYLRQTAISPQDSQIQFDADVYYRTSTGIFRYDFANSERAYTGREPAVRVTRWVSVNWANWNPYHFTNPAGVDDRQQVVLVEVLLWRG